MSDNKLQAVDLINGMMSADMKLYEKILDTPKFAYYFNELVKKAIELDHKKDK